MIELSDGSMVKVSKRASLKTLRNYSFAIKRRAKISGEVNFDIEWKLASKIIRLLQNKAIVSYTCSCAGCYHVKDNIVRNNQINYSGIKDHNLENIVWLFLNLSNEVIES